MALDPSSITVRVIRHPWWFMAFMCVAVMMAASLWRQTAGSLLVRPLTVSTGQATDSRMPIARRSVEPSPPRQGSDEPWQLRVIGAGETAQTVVETPVRTTRLPRPASLR
jgi:hypothetical protein